MVDFEGSSWASLTLAAIGLIAAGVELGFATSDSELIGPIGKYCVNVIVGDLYMPVCIAVPW